MAGPKGFCLFLTQRALMQMGFSFIFFMVSWEKLRKHEPGGAWLTKPENPTTVLILTGDKQCFPPLNLKGPT